MCDSRDFTSCRSPQEPELGDNFTYCNIIDDEGVVCKFLTHFILKFYCSTIHFAVSYEGAIHRCGPQGQSKQCQVDQEEKLRLRR